MYLIILYPKVLDLQFENRNYIPSDSYAYSDG